VACWGRSSAAQAGAGVVNRQIKLEEATVGRLQGKTAIITGATGGIGEATANLFLREGANVMLVGRSAEKLKETTARLKAGPSLAQYVANATDEAAIAAAVNATIDTFGVIDILFANAGTEGLLKPIETYSRPEFEQVLQTNVTGVWLAIKHCVEPMKKQGKGSIIATASVAGVIGFANSAPYIASKHAVCGLVRAAALELAAAGIRVNAIAPGAIDNRMIESVISQLSPQNTAAVREGIKASIPLKRYGANEEIASLVAFLASDEASYSTGAIFLADGGLTTG
jgi:NAD(P)-dependent dehydrogenase (short-subunit alcohol dehydrogenase family)